jgi:hypothetical protein
MIASAIQAAINPYSMAVAPDSSLQKRRNTLIALFQLSHATNCQDSLAKR